MPYKGMQLTAQEARRLIVGHEGSDRYHMKREDKTNPPGINSNDTGHATVKSHSLTVELFIFYLVIVAGILMIVAGGQIVSSAITPKTFLLIASLITCLTCVFGLTQFKKWALQLAKALVVLNALMPSILMACAFYKVSGSSIFGTITVVLLFSIGGSPEGFIFFPWLPLVFYGLLYLNYRLFKHFKRGDVTSVYS